MFSLCVKNGLGIIGITGRLGITGILFGHALGPHR